MITEFVLSQMAFHVFIDPLDIIVHEPSLSEQHHGEISVVTVSEHPGCARRLFHGMVDALDTIIAQRL